MKVDFMIIGAQKCGTSTLYRILNSHPQLEGAKSKEPHFFSKLESMPPDFEYYHSLFAKKEGVLYFEGSTTYTFYPTYHKKIWDMLYDYNPGMKFIYIVRHPVDRIISSYMHAYLRGNLDMSIESALIEKQYLINVTRYYTQISPFMKKFGPEKVLILDFDDLTNHPKEIISKVSAFLGVSPELFDENAIDTHENKTLGRKIIHHKYKSTSLPIRVIRKLLPFLWKRIEEKNSRSFSKRPELSEDFKDMIYNMLELEIREMEKLMGKDLSKWRMPGPAAEAAASTLPK